MFKKYRTLFPNTARQVYLNHAAISPLSTRVTDKLDLYINERSFGAIDTFELADATRQETRRRLGKLINADPAQIAFIPNTSQGFNHLVNGLNWSERDEIILIDYEFPSNIYPFLNLQKRFGVKVHFVANHLGQVRLEDVVDKMNANTRLLSISFVEFSNGYRNDLRSLGQICHERGILFSVDGIQGVGALPLDVQDMQIDFLSNGGHKWLMATMGAGFMYMSKALMDKSHPAQTGWLAVEDAWDFSKHELNLLPDARRYEFATSNFMGIMALSASLELLLEVGIEHIEKHLLNLGSYLVEEMRKLGFVHTGAADKAHWSGIFAFSGNNCQQLYEYLKSENIIVSLRNGNLRVAPHFYNTRDDLQIFVDTVRKFSEQKA